MAPISLPSTQVQSITKTEDGKFTVTSTSEDPSSLTYDAVIIATPLHDAGITLDSPTPVPPFQRTVATFVEGRLREIVKGTKNPTDILTTESDTPPFFSSIGTKGVGENSEKIYKVFSKKTLTENQMNSLFSLVREVKVVDWFAYPHYDVSLPLPPFELDKGLYHLNAIEQAASAIEMSCIGGRNVANLVFSHLTGTVSSGEGLCGEQEGWNGKEEL